METIADLRDWLKENHPLLYIAHSRWLYLHGHRAIEQGLSQACGLGLYDLCRALGIDTEWYRHYYCHTDQYLFKRNTVVPMILEHLYGNDS